METPLLFLVFNRPDTTQKVFDKIREAQPPRLYVAADGPRQNRTGEAEKCEEVRNIATNVDWDCEVKTLFQEQNIGCGPGPAAGISWFFENEKHGIILEDDCVPSKSFFPFCEVLLQKYANDNRIMHINGNNFGASDGNFLPSDFTYHFGRFPQVWGWATWRRAWAKYNFKIPNLARVSITNEYWNEIFINNRYKNEQMRRWKNVFGIKGNTWDFQWQFSLISNHGLTIVPKKNLISNIGFGDDATHTKWKNNSKANLENFQIKFPLKHPEYIIPDQSIDYWYQKNMLGKNLILKGIKRKIYNFITDDEKGN